MTAVQGWDATHANVSHEPGGQAMGYTTGSPDIRWTAADWELFPSAVRMCQDNGSDVTADELDVEPGAATAADAVTWHADALDSFRAGRRAGQREPMVYSDVAGIPALVDAFQKAGQQAVWLHLAHWGLSADQAESYLGLRYGPLIVAAVQYENTPFYDRDVWQMHWLNNVSKAAPPPPPPPRLLDVQVSLPQIRRGATGWAVRTLQGALVARWYHLGTTGQLHDGIDGDFGPITETAVRDVQGKCGLAVDGIVGPATWPAVLELL